MIYQDGKYYYKKICIECNIEFLARNAGKKYCSGVCKKKYWFKNCPEKSAEKRNETKRQWMKKYYHANKDTLRVKNREISKKSELRNKKFIMGCKQCPCFDCGKFYPFYVMEYHHRDPKTKIDNVSNMRNDSIQKVLEEINKCDIICSNCHRIREHKDKYTDDYLQSHLIVIDEVL